MKKNKRQLMKEIFDVRSKSEKLPPLSAAEQKIVEGQILIESVYHSAKLEGSMLKKEEVRHIIASDT